MDTMICETSEILAIPKDVAGILLRTYDWSSEKLCEAYYSSSNKEDLWKHSGIYHRCCNIRDDNENKNNDVTNNNINDDNTATTKYSHKKRSRPTSGSSNNDEKLCPICYEAMGGNNSNNNNNTNKDSTVVGVDAADGVVASMAMGCGHEFCTECWTDFCSNAILNEGPGCITTTCPDATCTEAVTEKEMQAFLSPEHFEKFRLYVLSSFVEANPMTRWCPAPGCGQIACATSRQALERAKGIATCTNCGSRGSGTSTTSSSSSYSFCMLCGEEPHAPCDCTTLAQWTDKNQSESETANWILVNTKSCPKCKVRIEKNSGCNHMTCHKCRHNFCWICLGSYEGYGSHRCNKFEAAKDESKAKLELERYLHYFTRYQAHKKSEEYAKKQLQTTEDRMIRSDNHTTMDIRFMKDVHEQLIDCRRVLKYSYAYGYFHMMHYPNTNTNNTTTTHKIPFQKERFEQHQAVLEQFTESLSGLSEKPMEDLLEKLRADAINQCRVVKKYIDNVLLHVEGGMDEDEF
mmetsp:Transcript_25673/g.27589  ORF Transcript_25673/g.27589 Transcript_25673/m.27589 type:complete len:519 (-) Transcript_25673:192-1748(-)